MIARQPPRSVWVVLHDDPGPKRYPLIDELCLSEARAKEIAELREHAGAHYHEYQLVQKLRLKRDDPSIAGRVIGCRVCACPAALVGDRIPDDGLCADCRERAKSPKARRAGKTTKERKTR